MRLWVDDVRPAPPGYTQAYSVNEAKRIIITAEKANIEIELLDLDHDAGDFYKDGGDYIKLLDWLIERGTFYSVLLHTANLVGKANMLRMIKRYWP